MPTLRMSCPSWHEYERAAADEFALSDTIEHGSAGLPPNSTAIADASTQVCHNVLHGRQGGHISKASSRRDGQVVGDWPSHLSTEIDGLSVLRLIGAGSVATAFIARETKPERLVALKVLKAEFAADAAMRARFKNAALAAARIVHPNVAAIYRVGQRADELPYIVQEHIGGQTLEDLLRNSEILSVDDSSRVVASLARALAAAHAHGIVHGSVNPRNVLIESDSGRVVLTDFGMVGAEDATRGEATTKAGDIFDLGAIADGLLSGRSEVPQELSQLFKKCLDKDPAERPTAAELARRFPEDPRPVSSPKSKQLTQRAVENSLKRIAVVAGLIIMAFGAAVGLFVYNYYSQEQAQNGELDPAPTPPIEESTDQSPPP